MDQESLRNDSDDEMLEAYSLANEIGVELSFCLTPWRGKSLRFDFRSLQSRLDVLMPKALNNPTHQCKEE